MSSPPPGSTLASNPTFVGDAVALAARAHLVGERGHVVARGAADVFEENDALDPVLGGVADVVVHRRPPVGVARVAVEEDAAGEAYGPARGEVGHISKALSPRTPIPPQ